MCRVTVRCVWRISDVAATATYERHALYFAVARGGECAPRYVNFLKAFDAPLAGECDRARYYPLAD
eukprot:scaffold17296_cov145-Isochrysis_galbana.AAC.3